MSRLSLVILLALCDARQVLFVGAKSTQKAPFCSLVWSGAVVGAPGADNLKIRPEFFPGSGITIPTQVCRSSESGNPCNIEMFVAEEYAASMLLPYAG